MRYWIPAFIVLVLATTGKPQEQGPSTTRSDSAELELFTRSTSLPPRWNAGENSLQLVVSIHNTMSQAIDSSSSVLMDVQFANQSPVPKATYYADDFMLEMQVVLHQPYKQVIVRDPTEVGQVAILRIKRNETAFTKLTVPAWALEAKAVAISIRLRKGNAVVGASNVIELARQGEKGE